MPLSARFWFARTAPSPADLSRTYWTPLSATTRTSYPAAARKTETRVAPRTALTCGYSRHTALVIDSGEPAKAEWVNDLPSGPPERDSLARIVDADGARDEAEVAYYEAAADPDFARLETEQRRFRGQYLRRLRRLGHRQRHNG